MIFFYLDLQLKNSSAAAVVDIIVLAKTNQTPEAQVFALNLDVNDDDITNYLISQPTASVQSRAEAVPGHSKNTLPVLSTSFQFGKDIPQVTLQMIYDRQLGKHYTTII